MKETLILAGTKACQEKNQNGYGSFCISRVPPTHSYYSKNKK